MRFETGSVKTHVIRESDRYAGVRASLTAHIGSAKLSVRLGVNFGDPIVPEPRANRSLSRPMGSPNSPVRRTTPTGRTSQDKASTYRSSYVLWPISSRSSLHR